MPRTLIGNFKGPKGNTGEQGPQGVPGPQGLPGEKGDPGAVDENTPIIFEVPETYEIPVSGNAIKVLFGKITKGLSDLFAAVGVLASLKTVEKSTLVAAINELAEKKFDVEKIVASANITEQGFVMDGKTASEAIAELYSKMHLGNAIESVAFARTNDGRYAIHMLSDKTGTNALHVIIAKTYIRLDFYEGNPNAPAVTATYKPI